LLKAYRIDGIASQDERDALRVVGFLEFAEALQRFDKLVAICSPEELQVIEGLLSRRDEFAIFTNLSRLFEKVPGPLSEQPLGPEDRFERRGLKWMMALARVEVGGVLAGFTNLKRPFETFPGTGYDRAEYAEMILDGLRTHYHVLRNDLKLDAVLKRKAPDVELLNYARSLVIAQAFCQAANKEWNGRLHAAQEAKLKQWQASLRDWQNRMQRNVNQFLAQADDDRLTACQGACQKMFFRGAQDQ
jgi:NADH:ubiquinone oxidoreductase subunit